MAEGEGGGYSAARRNGQGQHPSGCEVVPSRDARSGSPALPEAAGHKAGAA